MYIQLHTFNNLCFHKLIPTANTVVCNFVVFSIQMYLASFISLLLTIKLTAVKEKLKDYCTIVYSRSGVN